MQRRWPRPLARNGLMPRAVAATGAALATVRLRRAPDFGEEMPMTRDFRD